jgi:hypothetical protein
LDIDQVVGYLGLGMPHPEGTEIETMGEYPWKEGFAGTML